MKKQGPPKVSQKNNAQSAPACEGAKPQGCASYSLFRELPEELRAKLEAIPANKLRTMNAELFEMATVVLAAVPALRTLRGQIEQELTRFDLAGFDSLEQLAKAGLVVQSGWMAAEKEEDELPKAIREATDLRTEFLSECAPIARRGDIPRDKFEALSRKNSHQGIARFVFAVAQMLDASWSKIAGRTAITQEQVAEGKRLGTKIVERLAKREARNGVHEQRSRERQQMFTLLFSTYEQARRAAAYVRFEEKDADEFAPSIFAKRAVTRRKGGSEAQQNGSAKPADTKPADAKPTDTKPAEATARAMETATTPASEGKPSLPAKGPNAKG